MTSVDEVSGTSRPLDAHRHGLGTRAGERLGRHGVWVVSFTELGGASASARRLSRSAWGSCVGAPAVRVTAGEADEACGSGAAFAWWSAAPVRAAAAQVRRRS